MTKAIDMMTAAMKQATHEIACANNTASQLRAQKEALKAELAIAHANYGLVCAELDRAVREGLDAKARATLAENELAVLRKQIAALLPKAMTATEASVYGGGAGDLDTRDNGMVVFGSHAE